MSRPPWPWRAAEEHAHATAGTNPHRTKTSSRRAARRRERAARRRSGPEDDLPQRMTPFEVAISSLHLGEGVGLRDWNVEPSIGDRLDELGKDLGSGDR